MRSCRRFGSGRPGMQSSGRIPGRIHQSESRKNPASASIEKGGPSHRSTTRQVATEPIAGRKRETTLPTDWEPALEVGTPDCVRRTLPAEPIAARRAARDAAPPPGQPAALEEVANCKSCRTSASQRCTRLSRECLVALAQPAGLICCPCARSRPTKALDGNSHPFRCGTGVRA
jgi:hypothetical protein